MLRLIASAALVFSMFSCGDGTFFAEADVQHVCHSEVVALKSPVPVSEIPGDAASYIPTVLGPQHLTISAALDVSSSVPKIDKLTTALKLEHAALTAADGTSLPNIQHLVIDLNAPASSGLAKIQLVQTDSPQSTTSLRLTQQSEAIDALTYARSGSLELGVNADMEVPTAGINATLELCGQLTARYSL